MILFFNGWVSPAGVTRVYAGKNIIAAKGKDQDRAHFELLRVDGRSVFVSGVYDGHGKDGGFIAENVKNSLPMLLKDDLAQYNDSLFVTLPDVFSTIQHRLVDDSQWQYGGTTAVVACIEGNELTIGNVGDSRCVIGRINDTQIEAYQPLEDHGLGNEFEIMRLEAHNIPITIRGCYRHRTVSLGASWKCSGEGEHYYVKDVCGARFTRSLGDDFQKKTVQEGYQYEVLSSDPDIFSMPLCSKRDKFIILGSDGLWEEMIRNPITNQEAVELVHQIVEESGLSQDAAREAATSLATMAKKRWGGDDISVVVVLLDWQES